MADEKIVPNEETACADPAAALQKIMLSNIVMQLFQQHQLLINSVRNLPIANELKHSIIYSIGCGYLWAKDAVESLQFNQVNQASAQEQPALTPESLDGIEPLKHDAE